MIDYAKFPLGDPVVRILPGKQKYPFVLEKDFIYRWSRFDIIVPAGFTTDMFSIPRILWPVISPIGAGIHGAICHDCLYSTEFGLPGETIEERCYRADKVLYDGMIDSGCSKLRASIVYRGVRIGGKYTWKQHIPSEVSDDLQAMLEAYERWPEYKRLI